MATHSQTTPFDPLKYALYPTRSATWNLDRAKAPGIIDLKSPHINNMGRLKIDDPRGFGAVQIQVADRVGYKDNL